MGFSPTPTSLAYFIIQPHHWQHKALFDHALNQHPVGYHTGTNPGRIYMLRSEDGAGFTEANRARLHSEWDSAWHVTVRGVRMGTFTI